jgi:stalled ribosome rescue protein Dom34
VIYVYAVALEHIRRDGELVVVGQEEIQAVVEGGAP